MADGVVLGPKEKLEDCIACVQGKHAINPFHCSNSRAGDPLNLVHADVCGPIEVRSLGGNRFFVVFVDDATRKVFLYCLETKVEVPEVYQRFNPLKPEFFKDDFYHYFDVFLLFRYQTQ